MTPPRCSTPRIASIGGGKCHDKPRSVKAGLAQSSDIRCHLTPFPTLVGGGAAPFLSA